MHCPTCQTEVTQQEYLCLKTGDVIVKVRCSACRRTWESLQEFERTQQRTPNVQGLPDQICRVCGHDAPADELWDGLGGDAGICRTCRQCPGCGGVLFRREATQVVCEICGSYWANGREYAQDFLPRSHIFQ